VKELLQFKLAGSEIIILLLVGFVLLALFVITGSLLSRLTNRNKTIRNLSRLWPLFTSSLILLFIWRRSKRPPGYHNLC